MFSGEVRRGGGDARRCTWGFVDLGVSSWRTVYTRAQSLQAFWSFVLGVLRLEDIRCACSCKRVRKILETSSRGNKNPAFPSRLPIAGCNCISE